MTVILMSSSGYDCIKIPANLTSNLSSKKNPVDDAEFGYAFGYEIEKSNSDMNTEIVLINYNCRVE
ncbi:MAG: hypothetical protein EA414_07885 [Arthrospira sp. PLM2.Bin9]|nr:MAG: hypothetical protein EA414_07885 [Arthrospira sp. PLM2.Bin9]